MGKAETTYENMKKLYAPRDASELVLIKSILDGESLHYHIRNDIFGSLWVGPQIDLYNKKMILVQDDHYERARELLKDYLAKTEDTSEEIVDKYSFFDKVRMVIEFLLFSWMIPGRKKKDKSQ
jgi:hypothetical protein